MRRVERDLHDGTQARLVALGVTLSRIEHRSADDAVRDLARDARGTVTEALAELRDIVRGLHPPALDDGLDVALASLAGRSAVPVSMAVDLPVRPPDATASAIYFTVAELLTNVAGTRPRHACGSICARTGGPCAWSWPMTATAGQTPKRWVRAERTGPPRRRPRWNTDDRQSRRRPDRRHGDPAAGGVTCAWSSPRTTRYCATGSRCCWASTTSRSRPRSATRSDCSRRSSNIGPRPRWWTCGCRRRTPMKGCGRR